LKRFHRITGKKIGLYLRSLGKGTLWATATVILGFLQFSTGLVDSLIDSTFHFPWEKPIYDGVFLFFSLAVVSGIALDKFMEDLKRDNISGKEVFIYYVLPSIQAIACLIVYGSILGVGYLARNFHNILLIEMFIFGSSFFYILGTKSAMYRKATQ
jgi:hypothetical protein